MLTQFWIVGSVGNFYLIVFALYFVFFSIGYTISILVSYHDAPLVGVVYTLFWCIIFSGTNIRLTERSNMSSFEQFLFQASPPRWAIEAFYVNEMQFYKGYLDISSQLNYYQYDIDNFAIDIQSIFIITLVYYGLTIIFMKMIGRSKMK
mmetsp:Transcript_15040/g.27083  ORF Transcript_15040/g.27083 Transcript_15040/m.27083 type:complete len:149 (+) Transcript_15040:25-471(+)